MKTTTFIAQSCLVGLLAACSSSGGGAPKPSISEGNLTVFSITSKVLSADSGTADEATGDFSLAGLSGTYDTSTGVVSLDDGGTIEIVTSNDQVGLFLAEPGSGPAFYGVLGAKTPNSKLPTGTASYAGSSYVIVNDGNAVWELEGTSLIDLDFGSGTGTATLDGLDGTKYDANTNAVPVTDVATVTFSKLSVSGGQLSTDEIDVVSTELTSTFGGKESVDLDGAVLGADGKSIGAVFVADDTGTGTLLVQGAFEGH